MNRKQFLQGAFVSVVPFICKSCGINTKRKEAPKVAPQPAVTLSESPVRYFKKGDPAYNRLRQGFNKRINNYPAYIALCTVSAEVSAAVKFARIHNLPVVVKSGGHSFEGFSCENDALVVNCSAMKEITWIEDSVVRIGPGWQISELQEALFAKNKILPTGSCGGVGIGGLASGGGYGIFSREFGLTCDNIISAKVVDGSGVEKEAHPGSELLWGCKGGGNAGFGIITSLTFKVFDLPAQIQCSRFTARNITADRANKILKEWFSITENLPPSYFSAYVFNGRTVYILLTTTEPGDSTHDSLIEKFTALSDKSNKGHPIAIPAAVKQFYGMKNPVFFKNSSVGMYDGYADVSGFTEAVFEKIIQHKGMIFQVNTLGGTIINKKYEDLACFPHRNKKWLSEMQSYWNSKEQTNEKVQLFKEVKSLISSSQEAQYANYPDIDLENWQLKYYASNYKRLLRLKQQMDPDNIFRNEQTIS